MGGTVCRTSPHPHPPQCFKKSKSWQRRTRSTCDLHGNGNGFSWRSLSHNQELILKKHYPTTSQYGPLSARSELQSHPLAGQTHACGRLTRRMDRGPDGHLLRPLTQLLLTSAAPSNIGQGGDTIVQTRFLCVTLRLGQANLLEHASEMAKRSHFVGTSAQGKHERPQWLPVGSRTGTSSGFNMLLELLSIIPRTTQSHVGGFPLNVVNWVKQVLGPDSSRSPDDCLSFSATQSLR